VASVKTSPALPRAKALKWAKCQGCATPSMAEYIHSGETTMRLAKVVSRIVRGSNSFTGLDIWFPVQRLEERDYHDLRKKYQKLLA
jgi:hypothetical protein